MGSSRTINEYRKLLIVATIEFAKSDIVYQKLEDAAEKVAEYVCRNPGLMLVLSDILRVTAPWSYQETDAKLDVWEARQLGPQKSKAKKLVTIMREAFLVCTTDYEKNKVRGLIPERMACTLLHEKYFKKCYENKINYAIKTGCIVRIDGKDIVYECINPFDYGELDCNADKQTVDIAAWDSKFGEFGEIKVSPRHFHTKDIMYLRKLASELNVKEVKHEVYLISTQAKSMIQAKLQSINLWQNEEFRLIGSENFFNLRAV